MVEDFENLHWIIQYEGNNIKVPNKGFKWMTLWQINLMIKKKKLGKSSLTINFIFSLNFYKF